MINLCTVIFLKRNRIEKQVSDTLRGIANRHDLGEQQNTFEKRIGIEKISSDLSGQYSRSETISDLLFRSVVHSTRILRDSCNLLSLKWTQKIVQMIKLYDFVTFNAFTLAVLQPFKSAINKIIVFVKVGLAPLHYCIDSIQS